MSRFDFTISKRLIALTVLLGIGGNLAALGQLPFSTDISGFGSEEDSTDLEVSLQFTPASDGSQARLSVTAVIPEGFHLFAIDQGTLPNNGGGPMAARVTIDPSSPVKLAGEWKPSRAPLTHVDTEIWTGLELREHEDQITWTAPVEIVSAKESVILVSVEGQICNPNTCIPVENSGQLQVELTGAAGGEDVATDAPAQGKLGKQELSASSTPEADSTEQVESGEGESTFYFLITAFLAGLILNVMPCVLPVIGLKVMSFVQQAGQNRAQAFLLNCWYAAGIIIVFLILASLAVSLQLGWGAQFASVGFNLSLIGIVFAMALSLLGVWEIPIPGFVGSSKAMNAAEREGPTAAVVKGVLTTLLATPCIGPFLTPALTWALKQPAWMTYSVFGLVGLGMASPYLLIGAFPNLVRFLPKPGAWMETFKQVTGFILLLTVVWLLSFIDPPLVVPTVLLLVGIAIACWWVSRTPITSSGIQKFYAWTTAVLLVVISALGSYGFILPVMEKRFEKEVAARADTSNEDTGKLWQRFTPEKLKRVNLEQGKTVMVDFTADWCITCKALEKTVLKTEDVEDEIRRSEVVTMEADYTHRPPEIEAMIKSLGGIGVPLIAIFPAADPANPIVFSDGAYTRDDIIGAIQEAVSRKPSVVETPRVGPTSLSQADDAAPRY